MAATFHYLSTFAALAVFAVLIAWIWNMSRESSASLSQKLMRWRDGLQFVAVVVIMMAVYFRRQAG